MALHAFKCAMHSAQGEQGERVFEGRDFPELLSMAFLAIGQGSTMNVVLGVAGEAVLA